MIDKLLKWLKYFCADFGLAERHMISSVMTAQDVSLFNIICAREIDDIIKKYGDFRLVRLNNYIHFKLVQSGTGMIDAHDIVYMKSLINGAQSKAQTDNVVINYLRYDKKFLSKVIDLVKKIENNKLVGTLPFVTHKRFGLYIDKNSFNIMLHEGIHHILHNNGINYHWNSINEGLCVFLHFRVLENMRFFHPAQGSPREVEDILKEVDLGRKFYKAGTYGKQIEIWSTYFNIRFGMFKDHDVLRMIRRCSENWLVADMQKVLGNSYDKYKILKWYKVSVAKKKSGFKQINQTG